MIVFVFGTRPEAIKLFPVCVELTQRGAEFKVLFTGQHATLAEGTGFLERFGSQTTCLNLPSANDPDAYVASAVPVLIATLRAMDAPEWVVVQGDTASALAGARAASQLDLPLAHVEAGLRTFDRDDPWPEEGYRVEIDRLAQLHFAPTPGALLHLALEGHDALLIGNTSVDALRCLNFALGDTQSPVDRVLVTLHRRESFTGQPAPAEAILRGLVLSAERHLGIEYVWPQHPNPLVQRLHCHAPNLRIIPPLPYATFIRLLRGSRAVLTDSGGLIEEAATLGVPCVIAREKTERPESVKIGVATLAGRSENGIVQGLEWALAAQIAPSDCYGDGHASRRIADALLA